MQIQGVNIQDMINQSIAVLKPWPTVATFEQFEKRGGTREALIYIGVASAVAAVVAFVFGLLGGIGGAIAALIIAFISPIIGFAAFAYVLFYVARSQGGTGTQDEVFYTMALFTAPIRAVTGVVGAIPLIGCLFFPVNLVLSVYQGYLAYLACRASMNMEKNPAIISVVVAVVVMFIISAIVAGILGAIFVGMAVAGGALRP
jgi:hypothetical protein